MRAKKVTISKIIGNTPKSIENWEKEERKILELIYKYFTEEDLREFLETGEIGFLEERKVNENGGVISKIYLEMEQMKNKISELERTCNERD